MPRRNGFFVRPSSPRPTDKTNVSVSRNATERLLGIHQLISAQRHPNVHRLAREFEVSPKTIKRDIEWMRVHWQLPIEYHRQRRGYFYAAPVKQLPGVPVINAEERFALVVADKAVGQYGETPFRAPLRTAVHKLTGQRSGLEGHHRTGGGFVLPSLGSGGVRSAA
jgi:predicted DNA-binding transcriptional regulator YafY